jgi:hypothetical protein
MGLTAAAKKAQRTNRLKMAWLKIASIFLWIKAQWFATSKLLRCWRWLARVLVLRFLGTSFSVPEMPGDNALFCNRAAQYNLFFIFIGTHYYFDWSSSDEDGGASAAATVNLKGMKPLGKLEELRLNTSDTGNPGRAGSAQDVLGLFSR